MDPTWVVRAGKSGVFAEAFLNLQMVAIGWGSVGSLSECRTREAVTLRLSLAFPEYNKRQLAVNAGQLFRFREELTTGQQVLTYIPLERRYQLGQIVGDYEYRPDFDEELQHTRNVRWETWVSRDVLSIDTRSSLGSIATIFRISPQATAELWEKKESEPEQPSAATSVEQDAPHEAEELRANIEQQALELLQDRLNGLSWDKMQELVAGLLRAMGYKTRVSPPGADRGRDIVASPDGFGFQQPSIVVEVKHRKGAMGAPEVRSFIGGLRDGDRGLYVSSGGFTREALYEANRARHHLSLMDMDELARTVLEHYDQMDLVTRTLLPLRKIYWPEGADN